MSRFTLPSGLSFFRTDRYDYGAHYTCDFCETPRPHYCMGVILEGRGDFFLENRCVTVEKGDIIFVPIGSTYRSEWTGDPRVVYISAHFDFAPARLFPHDRRPVIQRIRLSDPVRITRVFLRMHEGFTAGGARLFAAYSAFFETMCEVYPHLVTAPSPTDPRIERAVDYIEEHYREPLSVPALCAAVGIGESQFYSLFREMTGKSPLAYKNAVALRHAELLLVGGEHHSIEEIAEAVGFSSGIYFREMFKKKTGVSPREYRKKKIE